jgi:hypothetical protein
MWTDANIIPLPPPLPSLLLYGDNKPLMHLLMALLRGAISLPISGNTDILSLLIHLILTVKGVLAVRLLYSVDKAVD